MCFRCNRMMILAFCYPWHLILVSSQTAKVSVMETFQKNVLYAAKTIVCSLGGHFWVFLLGAREIIR